MCRAQARAAQLAEMDRQIAPLIQQRAEVVKTVASPATGLLVPPVSTIWA